MRERLTRTPAVAMPIRPEPVVRRRLRVGPADDHFEREADAVADQIVANLRRPPATMSEPAVQRHAAPGEVVAAAGGEVPAETASRIQPRGDEFAGASRARMEAAFGADFSNVRVHTSATIDTAAEGLSADAFTLGRDVYVRRELYRPGTPDGDRLLAHELTHTLQQGGARIRRSTTDVGVSVGMPAERISRKKTMLYLDFIKMKRYDPKYGRAIKKALGMKVGAAGPGGSYGHWWTEIGERDPDTAGFEAAKSYGWWPEDGVGGIGETLGGVDGKLNGDGSEHDPHEGETGEAGLTEFHPAMSVDTAAESYDKIKQRVLSGIDAFARGYSGKWQWKLGWGQNCHTFQQDLKTNVKLHYKSANGWLEDPTIKPRKAAEEQAAKDKAAQDSAKASANLAAVAGKKWYTYTQKVMSTVKPDGDDGPSLTLDDTREFALTGGQRRFGAYYVQECVTRTGDRGWVPEVDLRGFSNMG